jgi:hypothetical protein
MPMVTVTGDFRAGDGTPVVGGLVQFSPAADGVLSDVDPVIVTRAQVEVTLDDTGAFEVELVGSYDPGWQSAGTPMPYRVRWDVDGSHVETIILIPDGGPWDLAQLVDLSDPPTFVPVPIGGPAGPTAVSTDPDNVAELGSDGLLYVPPLVGITDHGALTGLDNPDHPIGAVQGLQAALDGKAPTVHSHALGDLPPTLATDAEVAAAVAAHAAAPDPHPVYLSAAEGNAAYEAAGAVAAHTAAVDPHTGYQKESERGAASGYASLDGSAKVPIAQVPTGTSGTTVALGDHAHADTRVPPAYVNANGQQGATVTPTWPASVTAGQVAILSHAISDAYPSPATPAGFTLLGSVVGVGSPLSVRLTVWTRVCTGTETGNVATFDNTGSSYEVASVALYAPGTLEASGAAGSTANTASLSSATAAATGGDRVVHVGAGESTTPGTVLTSTAPPRLSLSNGSQLAGMLVADVADSGAPVTFTQSVAGALAVVSVVLRGLGGGGGLDQATADGLYVNVAGDTMSDHLLVNNADRLKYGLTVNRTVPSTTVSDNEIFRVLYQGLRATWTNEKGNLRTSNEGSKGEVAMKIIAASQAEGGSGNMLEILDIAGNVQERVGVLGRHNFNKGLRMVGDTLEIRDSTEADQSVISQALGGPLLINPKTSVSINSKKITSLADGTAATDAATYGQLTARTPKITVGTTAPSSPAVGDIWVDTN